MFDNMMDVNVMNAITVQVREASVQEKQSSIRLPYGSQVGQFTIPNSIPGQKENIPEQKENIPEPRNEINVPQINLREFNS